MLPSMPIILMTPMKESNDDSSDTSDDSCPHHLGATEADQPDSRKVLVETPPKEPEKISPDCPPGPSDGVAPQEESNKTKPSSPEKRVSSEPMSAQKKKKKTHHLKTLAALTPDTGVSLETSAQNYAEAYFQKVRSHLSDEKWSQFVQELVNFEAKTEKQPVALFRRMEELLSPYPHLVEEFLAFLMPEQALAVDRFMPYLLLCKMKEFFRKLKILLMKRQVRQVLVALESLAAQPTVTLAEVRAAVLPLLKSSTLLTSHFLELLPGERPPDSLMTDFEKVDLKEDSLFETVVVPDCADPYGNENCVCACHAGQKTRHCIQCGIKYLNGRVYLQYGKVLRPAKVTFKGAKHVDLHKWEEDKCQRRRRLLPKTMLSPSCLDNRLNADSEDDCGVKKSPRTPRIKAAKPKVCKKAANENKEGEVLEGIFPLVEPKNVVVNKNMMQELVVDCKMNHDGNDEHEFDDVVIEGECNTEEDEEEEKCIHSENESSLEAEDIGKELIDFSFEDEEVEDIENTEGMPNGLLKTHVQEPASNDQHLMEVHTKHTESKSVEIDSEINAKNTTTAVVKKEPDNTNEIQTTLEIQCCDSTINTNGTSVDVCDIKVESLSVAKSEDMDVSCEEVSSSVEQSCSSSEPKQESSTSNKSNVDAEPSCKEWTREEDKIILQTIQSENGIEQAFETAKLQLPNRTKEEIQTRFDFVLKLLKEMISDKSNS